jgi:predicted PurR-regulated permease PerM
MKTVPATKTTSDRLTTVLSYGVLLLLGYLAYLILEPFLVPLAWSAVFAIFFFPLHRRLLKKTRPALSALASTLLVTVLLIVPALIVLSYTTREAIDAASRLQSSWMQPHSAATSHLVARLQKLLPASLQNTNFSATLRQEAEKFASYLAGQFAALLKNLFTFVADLIILLFSLFFMFRDGDRIVRAVRHLLPFDAPLQDDVMRESRDLIFATVTVGLLIAGIQGTLGGIAFGVTGIRSPIFWGVVMAFFSLVPMVGSALIWVPAALWLGFTGHWGKGLLVLIICGGVAGIADNIVRPGLLRNRTQLNELLLFLSVLGGIRTFGLLGLVIGPTIVAAAMAVFRVYMQRRDELQAQDA